MIEVQGHWLGLLTPFDWLIFGHSSFNIHLLRNTYLQLEIEIENFIILIFPKNSMYYLLNYFKCYLFFIFYLYFEFYHGTYNGRFFRSGLQW